MKNPIDIEKEILSRLFEMEDKKFKLFFSKLIPTVNPKTIIGIRVPALRKYAKELSKNPEISEFMKMLPHRYFEENSLHALIIENMKNYDETIEELERFLPYVDNWAVCDIISPKIFKKHLSELPDKIKEWCASENAFTIRFAIGMLMKFYLDEKFSPEYLKSAAEIKSEEYYVNMAIAWFFATALAKQYEAALPYIRNNRLKKEIHNKTIQKATESFRITPEHKEYLKQLRRK